MAANGWRGARAWKERANEIAPTIVGGSKTWRARSRPDTGAQSMGWVGRERCFYRGGGPGAGLVGMPRLTIRMVARLQGFPRSWHFEGKEQKLTGKWGMPFRRR